jgi:hypothetical protein
MREAAPKGQLLAWIMLANLDDIARRVEIVGSLRTMYPGAKVRAFDRNVRADTECIGVVLVTVRARTGRTEGEAG